MSSSILLNVAWGLIALSAALLFALAERRHQCVQTKGSRLQRICAVLIGTFLLFPCVSASDDILGLAHLHGKGGSSSAPEKNLADLERVLQALETLRISTAYRFVLALVCIGLVEEFSQRLALSSLPSLAGRGPPSLV